MPKRTDLDTIVIIGAGPITIGQACEFDYSGTQACKALREEGYRVVLVNSNPATVMTDPDTADATYVEPITPDIVRAVMERERAAHPSRTMALLPTMGGQTALNTALALERDGALDRLGVEMIGARADVIDRAEDRQRFREAMSRIGLKSPRARQVDSLEAAMDALGHVGLPAIIRPSFTMGGTGGGIARTEDDYRRIVTGGLRASPVGTVLVEESVLGWKEFEMEVVRDRDDNCIIVCSIENIDPMGIHTGDSITVAPALTLTDKEYQTMRSAAIAVLREIGVETGGSNVQFAVNPEDGRLVVIEMNPRVSRSSALASKATGFPIAKIAAKLAVGYTLDELKNDITRVTPASFEPAIDYVVTKVPRFAFEKFRGAEARLTTAMQSVGEAMSVGRTFAESLQKAMRSMETGLTGLNEVAIEGATGPDGAVDRAAILKTLERFDPDRLLKVAQAMRHGLDMESIYAATRIDRWFLAQIAAIVAAEDGVRRDGLPTSAPGMLELKKMGFSDTRLAELSGMAEAEVFRRRADMLGITPVYRRIDTCAAEFPSQTSYMYGCYEGDGLNPPMCEAAVSDRDKVVILGGGPNRIGQGIEFDYCCVHAAYALSAAGYETIMVNCNPETVSTDYDTSDRLYFEPLTAEDVVALCRREQQRGQLKGVIVQLGGQTPLKLSAALESMGIPILGTPPDAIDLAEDRERFQQMLVRVGLRQPPNGIATSREEAVAAADRIGYPVVIRPSYVLGGRAMEIVRDRAGLERYIDTAVAVSGDNPVLIDRYLEDAVEVDVDAIADGADVLIAGVMEHIEQAGVHSGDSACVLPPHTLPAAAVAEMRRQTDVMARALGVRGLMNVQFAVRGNDIYVLEVNPRASRTVPFVAKATGLPVAAVAARVMAGESLRDLSGMLGPALDGDADAAAPAPSRVAVKEAVLPFARFPGVDVLLGPEMRSTGEVMGLAADFPTAHAKALLGAGSRLPDGGGIYLSLRDADLPRMRDALAAAADMGHDLLAPPANAARMADMGLPVTAMPEDEARAAIADGRVRLLFCTMDSDAADRALRRAALAHGAPHFTTRAGCLAAVEALRALRKGPLEVRSLQDWFAAAGQSPSSRAQ